MSIKLVDRHSRNRSGRTEAGIFVSREKIGQSSSPGDAIIWQRDDAYSHGEFALSTAFDWEICPNDAGGWITIRAYRRLP